MQGRCNGKEKGFTNIMGQTTEKWSPKKNTVVI